MRAKRGVDALIDCYLNEKSCENILPYEETIVNTFYSYLDQQNEVLKEARNSKIIKTIYELEIERIKFMLKEYLAIRLKKLKENFFCNADHLSVHERLFYDKYITVVNDYGVFSEHTSAGKNEEIVGFKCLEDIHEIMFDNNTIEMFKDDIFVGPLKDVYELLLDKKIKLI